MLRADKLTADTLHHDDPDQIQWPDNATDGIVPDHAPDMAARAMTLALDSASLQIEPASLQGAAVQEITTLAGAITLSTAGTPATDNSAAKALRVDVAVATYTVPGTGAVLNGTGLKIGILSDSFNLKGGEATDIANGDLSSSITILKEGTTGNDEGRAMAQLIHSIAPGAEIYFYTATTSETDFAAGIKALAAAGCSVIVDDVVYYDESFYQDTGVVTAAVEQVIAQGVDYFSAAGNSGKNYYESTFNPMIIALNGLGTVKAHNLGSGSPYEKVELSANATLNFTLEWTEPTATSSSSTRQYDIAVALFDSNNNLVQKWTLNSLRGNPVLEVNTTLTNAAGVYSLVFYENVGSATPGTFKIIMFAGSGATIDGEGAGFGSGTSIGHEIATGVNTVAAVNVAETPANGVATPVVESYSGYGSGVTYIDSSGTTLATPVLTGSPNFAATDGSPTSVFSSFYGTSAAAPEAAAVALLVLQADSRLATLQVTYVLTQSAVATNSTLNGGAGLIQADVAVGEAVTAATTPIWQGAASVGTGVWSTAADWTDNIAPRSTDAVSLGNGLGMLSGSYVVTFDPASATIAALNVDGGVSTITPDLRIGTAHTLSVTGNVMVGSGLIEVLGTLSVAGALVAGNVAGVGIDITGGYLAVGGASALGLAFIGTGGILVLQAADTATLVSGFTGAITNFMSGDTLELSGLSFSAALGVTYSGQTASVYSGSIANVVASLALQGSFSGLALARDATTGGTLIVACYVRGTRIATPSGEVAVEDLAEGDLVTTLDGTAKPIEWIGRRSYAAPFLAGQAQILPIRIKAGALADGIPHRDLLVSPLHAMYLNGALVAAGDLTNGVSILQEVDAAQVDYVHIELAAHDVIWAEGAASETFVDDDSRGMFHNAGNDRRRHSAAVRPVRYCAPRLQDGHALEDIRRLLAKRAGKATRDLVHGELRGVVECTGPHIVAGWAQNMAHPDAPVCLDIVVNGVCVMQTLANRHRPYPAGIAAAWSGFHATLPTACATSGSIIEVRRTLDQCCVPMAHDLQPAAARAA